MKSIILFLLLVLCGPIHSQVEFLWTELPNSLQRIANNAVVEAFDGNEMCVYSFAGIDSTKSYSGIGLKSFKYKTENQSWETIQDVPDTLGKIAAGASVIKNKIYVIGGYHVFQNGNEISSNKVHVFNPVTNVFEANGANIPVPIDDHVQVTWRDSLIFVISGWSNSGNVANVQIYNPALNQWTVGTATPNNANYKAFGASGVIIGDTIYYNGGVKAGIQFSAVNYLRKGVINPQNPNLITWSQGTNNPGANGYRMAATTFENTALWIGGAGVAYNYDGLAYSNGAGVSPLQRILMYDANNLQWTALTGQSSANMDFRGIAKISDSTWIVVGGMENNQIVSNKTFLIQVQEMNLQVEEIESNLLNIYPNPFDNYLYLADEHLGKSIEIYSTLGESIYQSDYLTENIIDCSSFKSGLYFLKTANQIVKVIKE